MGILNKKKTIDKEYKQYHREENYFGWWLIFLIGLFVLSVVAIVVTK